MRRSPDPICRERPIVIPMQCNEINSTEKRQKKEQQLIPKTKRKAKKKGKTEENKKKQTKYKNKR